jgi:hypothetical protein
MGESNVSGSGKCSNYYYLGLPGGDKYNKHWKYDGYSTTKESNDTIE